MSIWSDINNLLNSVVNGNSNPNDLNSQGSDFGYGSNSGSYQIPDMSRNISVTPDAIKDVAFGQGYTPTQREDPFQLSVAQITSITSDRSSPFSAIDIAPFAGIPPLQNTLVYATTTSYASNVITPSSISGLFIGMGVSGAGIPLGTTILSIGSTTANLSNSILPQYAPFTQGTGPGNFFGQTQFGTIFGTPFIGQSVTGWNAGTVTVTAFTPNNPLDYSQGGIVTFNAPTNAPNNVVGSFNVNFLGSPSYTYAPPVVAVQNALDNGARRALLQYLNISNSELSFFNTILAGAGSDYLGSQARTVEIDQIGNSFRMEKLPGGSSPSAIGGPGSQSVPYHINESASASDRPIGEPYIYPLIAKFAKFFTGCYVQFDSTDAPMFHAKPGEVYSLPFNRIYVTFFIADPKYRILIGRNAIIKNTTDERALRQNLSIWDASMILENQAIHPTPFSMDYQAIILASGGTFTQPLCSNYDSGRGLSPSGPGAGIGNTSNKGYGVLWITSISAQLSLALGALDANSFATFRIFKATYNRSSNTYTNVKALKTFWLSMPYNSFSGSATVGKELFIELSTPLRVVLAGFDEISNTGESGEVLLVTVHSEYGGAGNYMGARISIGGYVMGWLSLLPSNGTPDTFQPTGAPYAGVSSIATMPNNSYPLDVGFDMVRL